MNNWHSLGFFAGLICIAMTSVGSATDHGSADEELLACYGVAAIVYGGMSCQPPSDLVEAVYGKCTKEEKALKQLLIRNGQDLELADMTLAGVRSRMKPLLYSTIVESQIKSGNCGQKPD